MDAPQNGATTVSPAQSACPPKIILLEIGDMVEDDRKIVSIFPAEKCSYMGTLIGEEGQFSIHWRPIVAWTVQTWKDEATSRIHEKHTPVGAPPDDNYVVVRHGHYRAHSFLGRFKEDIDGIEMLRRGAISLNAPHNGADEIVARPQRRVGELLRETLRRHQLCNACVNAVLGAGRYALRRVPDLFFN